MIWNVHVTRMSNRMESGSVNRSHGGARKESGRRRASAKQKVEKSVKFTKDTYSKLCARNEQQLSAFAEVARRRQLQVIIPSTAGLTVRMSVSCVTV